MLREAAALQRELRQVSLETDLVVVGGGMAGLCCAITAARAGLQVVLIHDRPVLGGNASSEVRLWVLGATCHLGSPNRWSREGGVLDEILVENMWRNPEGNALIFDTVLLEKVTSEPGISLLLNTAAFAVDKSSTDTVRAVHACCSQNSTRYTVQAPLFCDASGDGVVAFLAGAAFRMGAESSDEFDEKFAPTREYGELLGHSIYFYSKDTGRPVRFVPPAFALRDIPGQIPRYRDFKTGDHGCRLWWIEYGGRLDTVHDTESIKWELWKVVYGVWDYIKNSGCFPEAANLTLEWVGQIPGKRESRRFEGDYLMTQHDIIEQRAHPDDVAFGGWALDLHPADGVYSRYAGCTHWRSRGVYPIPFRSLFSRNISNLFLAGRIISVSHAAFGSTRVMATLAHAGQAVGMAACLCQKHRLQPREISEGDRLAELQLELLRTGQHIPSLRLKDPLDLAQQARVTASSRLQLEQLPDDGPPLVLERSWAQLLPLPAGRVPRITATIDAAAATKLRVELRISQRPGNYVPEVTLGSRDIALPAGHGQVVVVDFETTVEEPCYAFFCLLANPTVAVHTSEQRITGMVTVSHHYSQNPTKDLGVESFEIWTAERRPGGRNFALTISPPLDGFVPDQVTNGWQRPVCQSNAWVADSADDAPCLTLEWPRPQTISRIELCFDTDHDHPMETVLLGHPERAMPCCVRHYRVCDAAGKVLCEVEDNHQTRNSLVLPQPVTTSQLTIEVLSAHAPTAWPGVFEVRCYQ